MIQLIHLVFTAFASALVSVGFTFFMVKRSGKAIGEAFNQFLELRDEALEAQLKPILNTNSKVMGIIANKGITQKQEKIALKTLGTDLLNQNEVVIEALKGVAPGFAEYLETHPDLVIQLMPRIEKLLESKGGIEGLLSGFGSPSPSQTRPHPFRTEV